MKKQNILFILTDQHRKNSIGCYGSKICKTPNIDALAKDGTVFDNTYCTTAICSPARASLQTGLFPFAHGMQTNIFQHGCMIHQLRDDENLLSRRLIEYGYNPLYTGKWHLGYNFEDPFYIEKYREIDMHLADINYPKNYNQGTAVPTDFGYIGDDFPGHGGGGQNYLQFKSYLADNGLSENSICTGPRANQFELCGDKEATVDWMLSDRTLNLIDKYKDDDKPFFMMLNYWGPHSPYYVPKEYLDMYRDIEIPQWESFNSDESNKPNIHNVKRRADYTWDMFAEELRYYYASVTYIDAQIGRIIDYLKSNNLYDDTTIIFSADHGDSLGIHSGLFDKGIFMYDDTTAIPLIIKSKNKKINRSLEMNGTCDIYSTILDIAGVPSSINQRHGKSLLDIIEGNTPKNWSQYAVTECSGIEHFLHSSRMIRSKSWKYVFNCGDIDELYNMEKDPNELNNLVAYTEFKDILLEMRQALDNFLVEKHDGLLVAYRKIIENK